MQPLLNIQHKRLQRQERQKQEMQEHEPQTHPWSQKPQHVANRQKHASMKIHDPSLCFASSWAAAFLSGPSQSLASSPRRKTRLSTSRYEFLASSIIKRPPLAARAPPPSGKRRPVSARGGRSARDQKSHLEVERRALLRGELHCNYKQLPTISTN